MYLAANFTSALQLGAKQLHLTRDPWWVIGSVALALHGVDPGQVGDVDFLISVKGGLALAGQLGLENRAGKGNDLFRSKLLLRQNIKGVDVEFMAGLQVRKNNRWIDVSPKTRSALKVGNTTVFVPEPTEMISILETFGRDKDIRRADKLRYQIKNGPSPH